MTIEQPGGDNELLDYSTLWKAVFLGDVGRLDAGIVSGGPSARAAPR